MDHTTAGNADKPILSVGGYDWSVTCRQAQRRDEERNPLPTKSAASGDAAYNGRRPDEPCLASTATREEGPVDRVGGWGYDEVGWRESFAGD
jgi:hypothetical protein